MFTKSNSIINAMLSKVSGYGQLLLVSKITWYNEIYIEANVYLG